MATVARLGIASKMIERGFLEPFFRAHGLQAGEFDVLATLKRAGAPYALGPTQLHEALMISSGGMTHRLDRLERLGLIERRANPRDRRGSLVTLTTEGLEKIEEMIALHVANEARALNGLSLAEQEQLNSLLGKLIAHLHDADADSV